MIGVIEVVPKVCRKFPLNAHDTRLCLEYCVILYDNPVCVDVGYDSVLMCAYICTLVHDGLMKIFSQIIRNYV